jgi:CheY-like chemotaxis protein
LHVTTSVLLVEDDSDTLELVKTALERRGYAVHTACDGREALELLADPAWRPSVILADLVMPIMDGWEMRTAVLRRNGLASIPFVVMSGIADLRKAAEMLRASDWVSKPVDPERLVAVIEGCTRRSGEP